MVEQDAVDAGDLSKAKLQIERGQGKKKGKGKWKDQKKAKQVSKSASKKKAGVAAATEKKLASGWKIWLVSILAKATTCKSHPN